MITSKRGVVSGKTFASPDLIGTSYDLVIRASDPVWLSDVLAGRIKDLATHIIVKGGQDPGDASGNVLTVGDDGMLWYHSFETGQEEYIHLSLVKELRIL